MINSKKILSEINSAFLNTVGVLSLAMLIVVVLTDINKVELIFITAALIAGTMINSVISHARVAEVLKRQEKSDD